MVCLGSDSGSGSGSGSGQYEAATSTGEGGERSRERAREAGPPRREEGWALRSGDSGYWRGRGGETAGTGGAAEGGQCILEKLQWGLLEIARVRVGRVARARAKGRPE